MKGNAKLYLERNTQSSRPTEIVPGRNPSGRALTQSHDRSIDCVFLSRNTSHKS